MSYFEAFILALIQGLTEFLPISSSAHLILPSAILGWEDQGLAFDVAVHVGTLMAVVIYFRHEVITLFQALFASIFKGDRSKEAKLADFDFKTPKINNNDILQESKSLMKHYIVNESLGELFCYNP